jgi:lipoate-protein ligase A
MSLHGEYKSPGGKLVVVDLKVADGRLTGVEVSGDFFLEPADALDDIVNALEGAPANAEEAQLAELIRNGLREDAELIGFDPESVAVAVRRAVTDGSPRERA